VEGAGYIKSLVAGTAPSTKQKPAENLGFEGENGLVKLNIDSLSGSPFSYVVADTVMLDSFTSGSKATYNSSSSLYGWYKHLVLNGSLDLIPVCTGSGDLETVDINGAVDTLASTAFAGCSKLKEVNGLNNVQNINLNAWGGCTSLDKLVNTSKVGQNLIGDFNCPKSVIVYGYPSNVIWKQKAEAAGLYWASIDTLDMTSSISLKANPKTVYNIGDTLDVSGGIVEVTNTNGNITNVTLTQDMVKGFSSVTAGTKTLTVTYDGKTCYYTVDVQNPVITSSISINTMPKTDYIQGETLDCSGGKLNVLMSNGTSKVIDITADMITGFEFNYLGY